MSDDLGRLWRLTSKELSECLRDRRTILTLVLMPLLLYPVLAMAFQQMLLSRKVEKEWPSFTVGFASEDEKQAMMSYWLIGLDHRLRRHDPAGDANMKEPPPFLDPIPELDPIVSPDVEAAVRDGKVHVGVRLIPAGPFRAHPARPLFVNYEVLYRSDSAIGRDAARYLEVLTADANARYLNERMALLGQRQRGTPVWMRAVVLPENPNLRASLLPVLVPLILILMTMTGAVYPAIDLTAGERERGTLEVLIAAPIPRLSVLLAKYFAVLTVAMLTALVNLGMMSLTLFVTGIGPALFGDGLTVAALAQVLALLLLFAAFFSAVLLTLTSFARSFKEAQSYLIPLMLFCLTPGIMALMPGLSLRGPLAVVPLLNIVVLARDILEGRADLLLAALVVLTTLLYGIAAILLAARVFGAEAVLSSESSGWADLLRRPAEPCPRAEPSAAMLCLAILFPLYFLVNAGLARSGGLDMGQRLLLASAINLALFAGVPLIAAWRGHVELRSGFGLRAPPVLGLVAALLLGVSLWPFVHEVVLLFQQFGIATLPESLREESKKLLEKWREVSPALIVVAMALIPAVVEELFFRGFLLRALLGENDRATRAIVGSSALFAIFHLVVSNSLAVERLLPSFLLGLVLGLLAYRSGGVIPGMLLHLLHNGSIVLLGYYEPLLVEQGWLVEGQEHYPVWLLASAAGCAVSGFAALLLLRRRA